MIIHTGNRTDIPAFYSKWFLNRIREGYVLVRNPYNPQQVTRFRLSPDIVDLLVFCTKNPAPLLPYMTQIKDFGQYWFVTITPYGTDIEPNVPHKQTVMEDFKKLSEIVGIDSVGWRYDPIFIDEKHSVEWHLSEFEAMAKNLCGYTKTCVISFIDLYKKVQRNFPEVREVLQKDRLFLGREFIKIASGCGMKIKTCAEGTELAEYGADCSGCMTAEVFETAIHASLNIPKGTGTQRNGACACILGSDIGAYDTCGHLCRYCYANSDIKLVKQNMKLHNPESPLIIGNLMPEDVIHEAKQFSWRDNQLLLF